MEIRVWDDQEARQPIPGQFDTWTHEGECESRFWEAPGEFAEWDSEVYG